MLDTRLLRRLIESRWSSIVAMPVQNNRRILLDLVVALDDTSICFTGNAHAVNDTDEVFSLSMSLFTAGGWWKELGIGRNDRWRPRYISQELKAAGLEELFEPPRAISFFQHRPDAQSASPWLLNRCAAIVISNTRTDADVLIGIAASTEYPCCIELCCGRECNSRFQDLEEMALRKGADY
jgi:hypothetical protein